MRVDHADILAVYPALGFLGAKKDAASKAAQQAAKRAQQLAKQQSAQAHKAAQQQAKIAQQQDKAARALAAQQAKLAQALAKSEGKYALQQGKVSTKAALQDAKRAHLEEVARLQAQAMEKQTLFETRLPLQDAAALQRAQQLAADESRRLAIAQAQGSLAEAQRQSEVDATIAQYEAQAQAIRYGLPPGSLGPGAGPYDPWTMPGYAPLPQFAPAAAPAISPVSYGLIDPAGGQFQPPQQAAPYHYPQAPQYAPAPPGYASFDAAIGAGVPMYGGGDYGSEPFAYEGFYNPAPVPMYAGDWGAPLGYDDANSADEYGTVDDGGLVPLWDGGFALDGFSLKDIGRSLEKVGKSLLPALKSVPVIGTAVEIGDGIYQQAKAEKAADKAKKERKRVQNLASSAPAVAVTAAAAAPAPASGFNLNNPAVLLGGAVLLALALRK